MLAVFHKAYFVTPTPKVTDGNVQDFTTVSIYYRAWLKNDWSCPKNQLNKAYDIPIKTIKLANEKMQNYFLAIIDDCQSSTWGGRRQPQCGCA